MPSWPDCSLSVPPPSPSWTVAQAQGALSDAACQILAVVDLLEAVHRGLPAPADVDERERGQKPYDVASDVLGTVECVLEDCLRPAIESLRRSAQTTDAELEQEFRQGLHGRWV